MTCRDCLHYDRCYLIEHYGADIEGAETCNDFKNKADFAEVVRCKDCKHSYKEFGELRCPKYSVYTYDGGEPDYVQMNHYCGYGERRDT